VDAARAVAILGMVMVHLGPYPTPDTLSGTLYGISEGRASVLFVLLAGIGAALLAKSRSAVGQNETPGVPLSGYRRVRARLASRALLLLPLGLWLQGLDHRVLVILQYYAVFFVFAALVLALPNRWLLAAASAALLLGPVVYLSGEAALPGLYTVDPATLGDPLRKLLHDLLLTGVYPLVTWSAPLMFGIWLGRRDLGSVTARRWLMAGGAAVALASALASTLAGAAIEGGTAAYSLLDAEPHGQTTLWMAGSLGSACAVLGVSLTLATARTPRVSPLSRLAWLLVATGQMALSVYVGHLLLIHLTGGFLYSDTVPGALLTVGILMSIAAAACVAWRAAFERGPLEKILTVAGAASERLTRGLSKHSTSRTPDTAGTGNDRRERH
jgi:hypothetical protein